jgi:hypothetical protein
MLARRSLQNAATLSVSRQTWGRFALRAVLSTNCGVSISPGRLPPRRGFARVAVPIAVLSALAVAVGTAGGRRQHGTSPITASQSIGEDLAVVFRSGALLGVSMYLRGDLRAFPARRLPVEIDEDAAAINGERQPTEDAALSVLDLLDDWRKQWLGSGLRGLKAQAVGRLADAVITAENARGRHSFARDDADAGQQVIRVFAGHGALSVFLNFLSVEKPTDRHLVVRALTPCWSSIAWQRTRDLTAM